LYLYTIKEKAMTKDQLRWHIESNFAPRYAEITINGMIQTLTEYADGTRDINDPIAPGTTVTVSDLLDDLRLDPQDTIGLNN
jgi:hypothetical protein